MFHVLEHLAAPQDLLRALTGLLNDRGLLVVEVPNVDDVLVSTYAIPEYIDFYYQKAHLFYYSPATLRRVLEAAGLRASVQCIQRYDISNHLTWLLDRQPGGQGRYVKILGPDVDHTYSEALCRAGLSDTLWAVAGAT